MARTILTPQARRASVKESGKTYWKQILPQSVIHYTDTNGKRQTANFDNTYLTDLSNAFHAKFMDQTSFLLADENNKHTMDPERFRGDVVDMRLANEGETPGLYAKIKFATRRAARAVMDNPNLGVSARIREAIPTEDGKVVPRGIIHVLGTLHPQVAGMSPWQQVDLSDYDTENVLDLSQESFSEKEGKKMPRIGRKNKDKVEDRDIESFTLEEIDALSPEDLDTFLETFVPDFDENAIIEDESDESDEDEDDEDDEDDDSDSDEDENAPVSRKREPAMSLSNKRNRSNEIDLSAGYQVANSRANEALRRMAEAEWKEYRTAELSKGVPPVMLDLAAPILNRPDAMVIDLSSSDEDDVNVDKIVRALIKNSEGTIDLSDETGHESTFSSSDDKDPDAEALASWADQS